MTDDRPSPDPIELTADIVSAFVSNNTVTPAELPVLISSVHSTLGNLGKPVQAPHPEKLVPPVPIRKSITPDYLISLEDGKRYKSLRRHLKGRGLTPEQYRAKWSLPHDYPMVAPNYSVQRSELARSLGLGRKRSSVTKSAAKSASSSAKIAGDAPKRRGSKKSG